MVRVSRDGDEDNEPMRVLLDPNKNHSQIFPRAPNFPYNIPEYQGYIKVRLCDRFHEVRTLTSTMEINRGPPIYGPVRDCAVSAITLDYEENEMADVMYAESRAANIILGADVADKIYLGLPQPEVDQPYAQNTIFGWSFFGKAELYQP